MLERLTVISKRVVSKININSIESIKIPLFKFNTTELLCIIVLEVV